MINTDKDEDLFQQIHHSPGARFLNRAKQRSFSLNIFQMNALELLNAVQRVKDPDQGMTLMMEANREASLQAHRELNRHIHNFVSSAATLVDHTRAFMNEYYAGTPVLESYDKTVQTTFVQSPVAQFVKGLRNYMVHKGLPNSSMYMKYTGGVDATMETGVEYDTASLLDWDRWSPIARTYLAQAEGKLDIHDFAQEYVVLVAQFQEWLDATLAEHHRTDLQELGRLQSELETQSAVTKTVAPLVQPEAISSAPFTFSAEQIAILDRISLEIFENIRELRFKRSPQPFETERPAVVIPASDVIGPITRWGEEEDGKPVFSFIDFEERSYGIGEDDFRRLDELADIVMQTGWGRESVSRKFVEKTFIAWARNRFPSGQAVFTDAFCAEVRSEVTTIEICAPIAHMEVESAFDFGPVRIAPVTSEFMAKLQGKTDAIPDGQRARVEQLFQQLRKEIQGGAAVFVSVNAEREFAMELGLRIAQDAVGILSFFAPAAARSMMFNPVGLIGASCIPSMKLIATHDNGTTINEGILTKGFGMWQLSTSSLEALQSDLLDVAASLVSSEGLNEFKLAVRASILNYTKGTTLVAPHDRLRNCVSSLEGVLLKHDMEPRSNSVAARMSILIKDSSVARVVQQIYWLLEQPAPAEYGRREIELIGTFTFLAYDVLSVALGNVLRFSSKTAFVEGIERMAQPTRSTQTNTT